MNENKIPPVGAIIETTTWFVLLADPQYLFSASVQQDQLRLVRGKPRLRVLEGPIQVPAWLPKNSEPIAMSTPNVPMWHVRVESVSELDDTWWETSVGGEDIEGWVLMNAFTDKEADVYI